MESKAIRALASRVETEEPSEALRAAGLNAFGCEADWEGAPDPLEFVDDAKSFQPEGWRLAELCEYLGRWTARLCSPDTPIAAGSRTHTEPRARTAASLRALAWEKENADG